MTLIKSIILAVLILFTHLVKGQTNNTQTIRGTVVEKVAQSPLIGVSVVLLGSNPLKGTITDIDGNFTLTDVPVGKQSLKFSMVGFEEVFVSDLFVSSGKEVVLNIQLEEKLIEGEETLIKAKTDKSKPQNEMLAVSSRTFSVEETQKYAASVNDPLRMATAFAGVVTTGDGNNSISIRGNSPRGLLWRMEGIDIPNPNHFSEVGASAGGISILSSQLLSNSDFSTGAFGAEYGNALSGVFDLSLRKGNNQKREHTFRAGFLGIDMATEGPFKKGYAGSYLVNYRYSTLGLISMMGVKLGDATTVFQDLSFNVFLPSKKYGSFSIFGFGGLSAQYQNAQKDTSLWNEDESLRYTWRFESNTGAVGATHKYYFGSNHYLKTSLLMSGVETGYFEDKLDENFKRNPQYEDKYFQGKSTLMVSLNNKFSSRHSLRSGFYINRLNYRMNKNVLDDSTNQNIELLNSSGSAYSYQAFSQWRYRVGSRLTTQVGLHYLHLALNGSSSLEPRASLQYDLDSRQTLSFGYGMHSQIQSLNIYLIKSKQADGTYLAMNKDLGLSKAQHFVLAYDRKFRNNWHAKAEVYYQYLYNIPVGVDSTKQYSSLNAENGSPDFQMVNEGKGKNYGIELTLEKYLDKGWYMLLSASVYDSKYQSITGEWHNTRYNGNHALSLTGGKEWTLSSKRKNRVVGINIKTIYTGGLRTTPVDVAASIKKQETVFDYSQIYGLQNPQYFRVDLGFSVRRNFKKATGTLTLDIQNASNRSNIGGQYFDLKEGAVQYWYQTPLIPVLSYKIDF